MKLDDFLKVKTVRCVSIGEYIFITAGKEYDVVGVDRDSVYIVNDNDNEDGYLYKHFEPVLDSAENPLQDMKLTPEFEAIEPTFKVGDKVYCPLADGQIKTLHLNEYSISYPLTIVEGSSDEVDIFDERGRLFVKGMQVLYHATQENYEMLSKRYSHIKFEAPPKPLTGSDLARAMLDKGWKFIPCFTSRYSEEDALDNPLDNSLNNIDLIIGTERGYFLSVWGDLNEFAVPFDFKKGEPLTESVLND